MILSLFTIAQELRGKVIAENGSAASRITVRFKDKSNAVLTNPDGSFRIIAKKLPDTLYFSGVGFEPYKIVVTQENLKDPNVRHRNETKCPVPDVEQSIFVLPHALQCSE